jgi:SAM-dependent methyltransferase
MATDAMGIGPGPDPLPEQMFRAHLNGLPSGARVLEIGTRRWFADRPTHHAAWLPAGVEHVKCDFLDGDDVDVVADAHRLTEVFDRDSFDAILAVSVWEHLRLPWVAATETYRVAKGGAPTLIVTHHTFPQHGYPDDYTRWDAAGIKALMEWSGFGRVEAEHGYPCQIVPPAGIERWNPGAPAWLNVTALGWK